MTGPPGDVDQLAVELAERFRASGEPEAVGVFLDAIEAHMDGRLTDPELADCFAALKRGEWRQVSDRLRLLPDP